MKLDGYIEHIDLGVDPQSGRKNILVRMENEFFKLTEEQQSRAWAPVKVASQILDRPAITIYQQTYAGKIPCKIIKKNTFDRHGLTLVNPYKSFTDGKTRKERDKERIEKTVKRALKKTPWLSPAQRLLLVVLVNIKVREFEREILKNEKGTGTGEGHMNRKLNSKRREAEVGSPQQPQDLIDKAAQPERLVEGDSSSEAANLQSKMKEAAKEFVSLVRILWDTLDDPNVEDLAEQIASYTIFEPHVYCTPGAVLFRLHREWIRLTRENVKEAFETLLEQNTSTGYSTPCDLPAVLADEHLALARTVCKEFGKVSWILPKLATEEQEVAK